MALGRESSIPIEHKPLPSPKKRERDTTSTRLSARCLDLALCGAPFARRAKRSREIYSIEFRARDNASVTRRNEFAAQIFRARKQFPLRIEETVNRRLLARHYFGSENLFAIEKQIERERKRKRERNMLLRKLHPNVLGGGRGIDRQINATSLTAPRYSEYFLHL